MIRIKMRIHNKKYLNEQKMLCMKRVEKDSASLSWREEEKEYKSTVAFKDCEIGNRFSKHFFEVLRC